MYKIQTNYIDNLYEVVASDGSVVVAYQYRSQAKDHCEALNEGKEYIPRSIEIYEELR